MFVELDTSIAGACLWLRALAETNVFDCLASPRLRAELVRRNEDPSLCVYKREDVDVWTSLAVYCDRIKYDQRIVFDCEDATGIKAAYLALFSGRDTYVSITQPHGKGMAHAYCRLDEPMGPVVDFSVECGMKPPPRGFYNNPNAETASMLVRVDI